MSILAALIHMALRIQIVFLVGMSVLLLNFLTSVWDSFGMGLHGQHLLGSDLHFIQPEDRLSSLQVALGQVWKHPVFFLRKTVESIPLQSHKRESCQNLE